MTASPQPFDSLAEDLGLMLWAPAGFALVADLKRWCWRLRATRSLCVDGDCLTYESPAAPINPDERAVCQDTYARSDRHRVAAGSLHRTTSLVFNASNLAKESERDQTMEGDRD